MEKNVFRTSIIGTAEYMSPEMINFKYHGKAIDIWCLGIFLYELLMGHSPFKNMSSNTLKD